MRFFAGLHHPHRASDLWGAGVPACISVNALRRFKHGRRFLPGDWILDSGAFSQIANHGRFLLSVEDYAAEIERWSCRGSLLAAVAQDYMCEPFIIAKTGLSVTKHQVMTIERYCRLQELAPGGVYIMPVLQGYALSDYARHLRLYGDLIAHGAWVGVGSVCKRNANSGAISMVLDAILDERPDLRLHGFGVKVSSLKDGRVRGRLHSADSMAWSFAARYEGRSANDWREALAFAEKINRPLDPLPLFEGIEAA